MWLLPKGAVLRHTSVRLAVAFSLIVFGTFAAGYAVLYLRVQDQITTRIRADLQHEFAFVVEQIKSVGLDEAGRLVTLRDQQADSMDYFLEAPDGQVVVGHHREMSGPDGFHEVDAPRRSRPGQVERLLVLSGAIDGGLRLHVGDDIGRAKTSLAIVTESMLSVGVFALLLCIVAGFLITRLALGKLQALDATLKRVAGGDLLARYPTTRDATDIDSIGEATNSMLDRIDELIHGLRRVSQDLAHDLRKPLAHLQQRLERARLSTTLAEKDAAIEKVEEKLAEILRLANAILRLNEIEAADLSTSLETVDVGLILEDVADAYSLDIEQSGREIEISARSGIYLRADPNLLAVAIGNLLDNALRHTPSGAKILCRCDREDERTLIEVIDNGIGIPADQRSFVLKPFTRLDISRSTEGFGIGLSLVSAVVRRLGGALQLDDANPGLAVRMMFPDAAAPQ